MESAMRIDSLERENDLRLAYLDNMIAILRDKVKHQEIEAYDSTVTRIQDTLLTASEREALFVSQYEEQERFGVSTLEVSQAGGLPIVFMTPVRGKVHSDNDKHPNFTQIDLSGQVPVMAPLDGNVVSVVYLLGEGYQIAIQHNQDYLTIYTRLCSVNVSAGDFVKAGYVIGQAGNSSNAVRNWMGLQVWHKGKLLDAAMLMSFD